MKFKLAIISLLLFTTAKAQTVAFFGEAVCKTKIKTFYYRFDNETFSQKQVIPTQHNFEYGKRFKNSYRIAFSEKELRKHRYIYFSNTITGLQDSTLTLQNRLDLTQLFVSIDALTSREITLSITNDLLLEDHFDKIISFTAIPSAEETKYIGTYSVFLNSSEGTAEINLDSLKTYHIKYSNEPGTSYFLNEGIGTWELGKWSYNPNTDAVKIRDICKFNRHIGNMMLPVDVGSSYDILIKGDRLLYPTGSEALAELKRK